MDRKPISTASLLTEAFDATTRLVRGEIALARAEIEANLRSALTGVVLILLGLSVLFVALNVLSGAAVAALVAEGITPGWAALIVAAGLIFCAGLLALAGRRSLSSANLLPRRTAENIRRDALTLKEAMTHDTCS